MSTQYISRTVPLSYRGYATCDRCAETYYPEQSGQTTCNLCHTEQGLRGDRRVRDHWNAQYGHVEPGSHLTRICCHCGASYVAHKKASASKWCSHSCYKIARNARKRAERKARNA